MVDGGGTSLTFDIKFDGYDSFEAIYQLFLSENRAFVSCKMCEKKKL